LHKEGDILGAKTEISALMRRVTYPAECAMTPEKMGDVANAAAVMQRE
jgi:hypothetical protein